MAAQATSAIARRAFADSRARNISYALLFAGVAYANVVGYTTAYPTAAGRLAFARDFGNNASVRLFYGKPYDLLTVGGYSAWRIGGFMSIFAGIWGVLAAVRAFRAEEDSGRQELVLAGVLSRRHAYLAALAAIAAGVLMLWLVTFLGLAAGGLSVGGSAYLALATVSVAPVFAGVGALASQFAPTRRIALELGIGALAAMLVARVLADTSSSLEWLRWLTPLGWVEELRPFTGARPAVLLLPLALCAGLLVLAGSIAARRDVGSGLLATRDSAPPRSRGLSSTAGLALRGEIPSLAGWLLGTGFFALIVGLVSNTISSADISGNVQSKLQKLGGVSIVHPAGYIGLCFLFFLLSISLFCCSQLAAARHEEAEGTLETLFALPAGRAPWMLGRLLLAAAGALALSLTAGLCAWLGGALVNAHVPLSNMLEAAVNCMPIALLFLGLAALAFALVPRAGAPLAYGIVACAFVWQLFGGLLNVPHWLLEVSPFAHVGLVPAQPLRVGAAVLMCALGAAACALAVRLFSARDLIGN